jgi:hypothetical protein
VKHTASIALIAALVANSVHADDVTESQEIVLTHELRSSFYERAPRSLAAAMSNAVDSWCSTADGASYPDQATADALSWLCRKEELSYFRSIYINGSKGRHGLVCETFDAKYLGMDLITESVANGSCVPAEFDGSVYELYIQPVSDN